MHPDPHPALDPALDPYPWSGFVPRYKLVLAEEPADLEATLDHLPLLVECADWPSAQAAWTRLTQDTWIGTLELWKQYGAQPSAQPGDWMLVQGLDRYLTADGQVGEIAYPSDSNTTVG